MSMADDEHRRISFHINDYNFLTDLVVIIILTSLALGFVFLPELRETPFRFVFGILFVAFLPGYAVIAALFPERNDSGTDRSDARSGEGATDTTPRLRTTNRSLDGLERVVLSVGLSSVIVVLLGLLLNYTPLGIRLVPLAIPLTSITVAMTAIAAIRRWELDKSERFHVPFGAWVGVLYAELAEPDSKADVLLNFVIVVAVVVAVSSLVYATAISPTGEQYTELYLVTEDNDSELVADNYPEELVSGENHSLTVGITNHELEATEYSIIVELQRVETDDETRVIERQQLRQLSTRVENNQTRHHDLEMRPEMTGENQRLAVMLYNGEPPEEPTLDNAYRSVHLWVDVVDEGE